MHVPSKVKVAVDGTSHERDFITMNSVIKAPRRNHIVPPVVGPRGQQGTDVAFRLIRGHALAGSAIDRPLG